MPADTSTFSTSFTWFAAVPRNTALRLARYFGTSERFWMNLQTRYDLEVEKGRLKGRLAREVAILREAS